MPVAAEGEDGAGFSTDHAVVGAGSDLWSGGSDELTSMLKFITIDPKTSLKRVQL